MVHTAPSTCSGRVASSLRSRRRVNPNVEFIEVRGPSDMLARISLLTRLARSASFRLPERLGLRPEVRHELHPCSGGAVGRRPARFRAGFCRTHGPIGARQRQPRPRGKSVGPNLASGVQFRAGGVRCIGYQSSRCKSSQP